MGPWREDRVAEFWRFVAERHEVFRKRIILREPPPWTDDPVIQTVAFTNIYRELDRTTRVLLHSLPVNLGAEDLLFNIIKFRFFTWSPTYWALGGYRSAGEWPQVPDPSILNPTSYRHASRVLVGRQKLGHQVFTGAFMVTSLGAKPGLGGKVQLVVKRISWVKQHLSSLARAVFNSSSAHLRPREGELMQKAHKALCEVPGFGGFMAYEVLVDLTYTGLVPWGTDSWVFVGPGAVKGLKLLLDEDVYAVGGGGFGDFVALLRDQQEQGLRDAQAVLHGPRLTLENVEQALCEFQKYVRLKRTGRAKRKFDAAAANTDYSLWDDLPPRFTNQDFWVKS